nr:immunoglobulin light chain junction region [Macaca mulatta]
DYYCQVWDSSSVFF